MSVMTMQLSQVQNQIVEILKAVEKPDNLYIFTDGDTPLALLVNAETYQDQKRQAERALMRESYLRKRIEEGTTNADLQKLLKEMDRIEKAYTTNPEQACKSTHQLGLQKREAWCKQHGLPNHPGEDLDISDLIIEAVKKVRHEKSK
ncbi:hypothetical protein HYR99_18930 [Candidatus Poribacteria bacterium]|nr:hypothetical protein [Candidatus Poribacteria bacterium]